MTCSVPAVRLGEFAGRFEMSGDQFSILIGGARIALLDSDGEPAVCLRAGRTQLRFVGDGANQRMAEAITLSRDEFRLIDQLGGHQLGQPGWCGFRQQRVQGVDVEVGADHRGGV